MLFEKYSRDYPFIYIISEREKDPWAATAAIFKAAVTHKGHL